MQKRRGRLKKQNPFLIQGGIFTLALAADFMLHASYTYARGTRSMKPAELVLEWPSFYAHTMKELTKLCRLVTLRLTLWGFQDHEGYSSAVS